MKRILSMLLAAVLAAAVFTVPAGAAAATAPWVQIDGRGTASQTVSVRGLSGLYNGVQVTLNLNRAPGQFQFDDGLSGHTVASPSGNSVTLYVASRGPLNQGDTIALGELLADSGFTVASVTGLKLMGLDPDPVEIVYGSVSVNGGNPGQGGGSGGGWSDGAGGWGGGSTSWTDYPVGTAAVTGQGSLQISGTHAKQGDTVTVTAVPGAGYTLGAISAADSAGRPVSLTALGGGKYSFVMPASAVSLTASFVPAAGALPFWDVGEGDWFRDAVAYVYGRNLMGGTAANLFSPDVYATRGMIVTILHRFEGSPAGGANGFPDVPAGEYYAGAVAWAASNGIVGGDEAGLFRPDQAITREQMAAIFYRYAHYKGYDVSARANLSAYWDAAQVSAYAQDAMAWANGAELINGVEGGALQPGGKATRAQVATILMRFCTNVAKV